MRARVRTVPAVALVPAYQAESTVGAVVRGALAHVATVVVVDDGSSDATGEKARAAGAEVLRRERNGGKGQALRSGLALVLASDATHVALRRRRRPARPGRPARAAGRGPVGEPFVIGSRMGDPEAIPAYRYRTNEIGSRILTRMTGHEIEDAQSGYRVVSADLLRSLGLSARATRSRPRCC
jgi:glycosyltransferase involved in cell wall biosynthesis